MAYVGRSFGTAAAAALLTLAGATARAQITTAVPPEDRRQGGDARSELPTPPPVDTAVHRSRGATPPSSGGQLPTGGLYAWTAQALKEGEGRLVIGGVARVVKPGETVEGYVVKAVGPGRVVLEGPAPRAGQPAGPVLAVMTFDARGRSRVGLIFESDPTPVPNPPAPGR